MSVTSMQLDDLIGHLSGATVTGSRTGQIRGIACDARRVQPGGLFVALPAEERALRDALACAIQRGAQAVVSGPDLELGLPVTHVQVPDPHLALVQAARFYYGNPGAQLTMLAIVGDETALEAAFHLTAMLDAAGRKPGLISSIHHEIGDRTLPASHAQPCPLETHQLMAAMVRAGCQTCVVAVENTPAGRQHLLGVEFDLVFQWQGASLEAGMRPADSEHGPEEMGLTLKEWDKNKAAVVNIEAVFGSRSSGTWNPHVQLAHGNRKPLSLHAGHVVLDQQGSRFVVNLPERCCDCRLSPPRHQSIYSGLAAAAAALELGLPDNAIAWALRHANPIPGFLEPIQMGQPFGVYVDAANRPAALRRSLESLRRVTPGRVLLLVGQPADHSREVRMAVGRTASILADRTVVTNDNPAQEVPMCIAADIIAGALPARCNFDIVLDRAQAIRRLVNMAKPGDSLLLAGKGHQTRQEERSTIRPFDDRTFARKALAQRRA